MNFEHRPTNSLRPYSGNARTHSPKQVRQIARSIERFGFNNPILIDDDDQIIAGHGRVEAAKQLRMKTVPCVRLSHLSEDDKRAYVLADNRLAEKAGWDNEVLAIELQHLVDVGFDIDHRARCCESLGIGVPVFLPSMRAHWAVMSAIVY